jgi:MFS family permease
LSARLDRERIIAKAGFNRWLVPPAALASIFASAWPMASACSGCRSAKAIGTTKPEACAADERVAIGSLFTTTCDWKVADLGWMYTLFFVLLGSSAAIWGGWLERSGPRKAGFVSALCWCGGLSISAIGVYTHQLWLLWLGSGVIGGIGLGLGYISPVSTLVKWFPDRRGMATGMAIMGFGGGAMIGSPLADLLMNYFKTPTSVGVWQTFVVMAAIYFVFMMGAPSATASRPPAGARKAGPRRRRQNAMITTGHVHLAMRTRPSSSG